MYLSPHTTNTWLPLTLIIQLYGTRRQLQKASTELTVVAFRLSNPRSRSRDVGLEVLEVPSL